VKPKANDPHDEAAWRRVSFQRLDHGQVALLVGILTDSVKQASDLEPAKKRKGEQGNGQSKASGGQDTQQEQPETGRQNRGRVGQE
jgi:hypothetical protein